MEESPTTTKRLMESPNSNEIALKLLRVNGQTHTFHFIPSTSASQIANHVYENWPEDWIEDTVNTASVLRLIYQGRFIHGDATLGGLKIPSGKTTVMHLVSRETLPEPNSQGPHDMDDALFMIITKAGTDFYVKYANLLKNMCFPSRDQRTRGKPPDSDCKICCCAIL